MEAKSIRVFVSAGEASGEHYGALLIAMLRRSLSQTGLTGQFTGMGGKRMVAEGLEPQARVERMAVMGFTEVVSHLPRIWLEYRRLVASIRRNPPDVAVLIDFPEIHFRLAKEFKQMGVPVVFFVSPQLWAWKKHRLKLVERYIDRMLVIFPFEEQFYRDHGVGAEFVGHPLAELDPPQTSRKEFAAAYGLDASKRWIGLLPGSRAREISDHLPEMLKAGAQLQALLRDNSEYEFLVPVAPTLTVEQRARVLELIEENKQNLTVKMVDEARAVLQLSRASVVASGTATVEAALIGNPFVVIYRVSALTYAIAKRVVRVPHVAMANLIAGRRVVPELIQEAFSAEKIVEQLLPLLSEGADRQFMVEELSRVRGLLRPGDSGHGTGAIGRVAEVALELARQGNTMGNTEQR